MRHSAVPAIARPAVVFRAARRGGAVIGGRSKREWARAATAVALCVVVTLIVASCSGNDEEPTEQTVDLGTHGLRIRQVGQGVPTVVIDVGLGDRSEHWAPLVERIAGETGVCVYDRAGYGESDAGPLPRDSGRIADELRTLLREADVPGPYVLVGHSLGGLNVQVFADRYRKDVAGLVLLDPPPLAWIAGESYGELRETAEGMTAEWQAAADAGEGSSDPAERREAAFFATLASEHREMFGRSAELAAEIRGFGATPIVVIASGAPNPRFGDVAEEYQQFWIEESRARAGRSTRGRFVLAERSSHNLYADVPDLVVESILSVVEEARRVPGETR